MRGVRAAAHLDQATLPRYVALVGDAEQLKPDADGLQGRQSPFAAQGLRRRTALEHIAHRRRVLLDHALKKTVQQVNDLLAMTVGDDLDRLRVLGSQRQDVGLRREHQITRSRGVRPAKKSCRFSMTRKPMASRVSKVALPRCGSSTALSQARRSGCTEGSPS